MNDAGMSPGPTGIADGFGVCAAFGRNFTRGRSAVRGGRHFIAQSQHRSRGEVFQTAGRSRMVATPTSTGNRTAGNDAPKHNRVEPRPKIGVVRPGAFRGKRGSRLFRGCDTSIETRHGCFGSINVLGKGIEPLARNGTFQQKASLGKRPIPLAFPKTLMLPKRMYFWTFPNRMV